MANEFLKSYDKETQIEYMKEWFFSHYEDPANECPYCSKEGGYFFIYGGPYEPRAELEEEFGGIASEEAIEELADELENIALEWTGTYDDYYDDSDLELSPVNTYNQSIEKIKSLLQEKISVDNQNFFLSMLFVQVIGAMEKYLSDFFVKHVKENREYTTNFIVTNKDLANFKLQTVIKEYESLEDFCIKYLKNSIIWHNLQKVSTLYHTTFNIKFPNNLEIIYEGITKRHDIVHRNGVTKENNDIIISREDIDVLINAMENFINTIESQYLKHNEILF